MRILALHAFQQRFFAPSIIRQVPRRPRQRCGRTHEAADRSKREGVADVAPVASSRTPLRCAVPDQESVPQLVEGAAHLEIERVLADPELPEGFSAPLTRVQNELFDLGADLSVPYGVTDRLRVEQPIIDELERLCDRFNADLPELKSFVLPGGTRVAAQLHVARTVCRRAERDALAAAGEVELNPLVLVYLNRLSDLLFILARAANAGAEEPLWKPGVSR